MLARLFSHLQPHFFGRLQSRRFDTSPHQPAYCPARHEAAHKRKKAVEAAYNLDHTPTLQCLQSRLHDLFRGKARQFPEKPLVVSEHVEFSSD